ncbi:MAG: hypothetical protein AVDCRST_MAG19-1416, partial [uncultured Thermomicrobiales bacterium]
AARSRSAGAHPPSRNGRIGRGGQSGPRPAERERCPPRVSSLQRI